MSAERMPHWMPGCDGLVGCRECDAVRTWLKSLRTDLEAKYRQCRVLEPCDIAGEVILALIVKYPHLVGFENGRATAFGIARNIVAEAARKERFARVGQVCLARPINDPGDAEADMTQPMVAGNRVLRMLRRLWPRLSATQRSVLRLLLRGGHRTSEIAITLQVSAKTVNRSRRAIAVLARGISAQQ